MTRPKLSLPKKTQASEAPASPQKRAPVRRANLNIRQAQQRQTDGIKPPERPPLSTTPNKFEKRSSAPRRQNELHEKKPFKAELKESDQEGIRITKYLAEQGIASRREADEWIEAGWIAVDGKIAVLGQRILPQQKIEIDPAAYQEQARKVSILLHKPIGYVSGQAEDGYQPASVLITAANRWPQDANRISFSPKHLRGLAPAGRLDIDSTGLLVLTQDGRIAKQLIGEDSEIEKEYLVRVEWTEQPKNASGPLPKIFPAEKLKLLNHGLKLDGKSLKLAKVSWQNDNQLRFVLREGKKRQIRRMCELVGLKVLGLKRVRIGQINLSNLPIGQWRYLNEWEKF